MENTNILQKNTYTQFNINEEFALKKLMPEEKDVNFLASFFAAFSDETRLKVIILLCIKPLCVGEISNVLNINQSTISHQLKLLKDGNIIDCSRCGKNMLYYIKNSQLEHVLEKAVDCLN
ncbi:MAG: metalloregulator ArsR/SmtB family transcription factor [Clostridia bacterium]|nr:metalloregulator ArsR/SmtB family transcription factor [Clostridia bacterium]MCQ2564925.1 metalloregulator ArsR/SmtB family transcription factor [Clostridia bacterium]